MERNGDYMEEKSKIRKIVPVLLVVGVFLLLIAIGNSDNEEENPCIQVGCGSERAVGSYFCYVHKPYYSTKSSYSSSSGSSSSTNKSTSSSSSSSSTKKSSSSSSSKKSSSSSSSSWKSYDEGYDAIYEDDDYDWDRYWSDSDYADGVDDAWEDMEDEGDWDW